MLSDEGYATSFVIIWKSNFGSAANENVAGLFSYREEGGPGNIIVEGYYLNSVIAI